MKKFSGRVSTAVIVILLVAGFVATFMFHEVLVGVIALAIGVAHFSKVRVARLIITALLAASAVYNLFSDGIGMGTVLMLAITIIYGGNALSGWTETCSTTETEIEVE